MVDRHRTQRREVRVDLLEALIDLLVIHVSVPELFLFLEEALVVVLIGLVRALLSDRLRSSVPDLLPLKGSLLGELGPLGFETLLRRDLLLREHGLRAHLAREVTHEQVERAVRVPVAPGELGPRSHLIGM